jgi:hypothetical protein
MRRALVVLQDGNSHRPAAVPVIRLTEIKLPLEGAAAGMNAMA